jgi:DNA-binding CsgD family transcriptional regulator
MTGGLPQPTVAVVGPDGSGRTTVLGAIVAAHDGPVVHVRPTPLDRTVPFGGLAGLVPAGGPGDAPADAAPVAARLAPGTLVVVDDAHLLGPEALRLLAGLAGAGVAVTAALAPVEDPVLAGFVDALLQHGTVRRLEPLDEQGAAAIVVAVTGRAAPTGEVLRLLEDCGGEPALLAAAATEPLVDVAPALADRVARRAQRLSPGALGALRALAVAGALPDRVLARLAGVPEVELGAAMAELAAAGLLVRGTERPIPAVARAVLTVLPGAERRRVEGALGSALADLGVDPLVAAEHLRRARAAGPEAATLFATAGDRLRYRDPDAAVGWYEEALLAGASGAAIAGGRAEAMAALGLALPDDTPADPRGTARLRTARAVVAVRDGRWSRAADLLTGLDAHDLGAAGRLLAVPALVGVGRLGEARAVLAEAATAEGPTADALALLARAAVAAATGAPDAVARFVEAGEAWDRQPPEAPEVGEPHVLGAVVASRSGDAEAAEQLLAGRVDGVHAQLTLAWVRLRAGRFDTAAQTCRAVRGRAVDGRDRLLLAALEAGLARRSGDIARLRDAWDAAGAALIRQTVDLWAFDPLAELLLAATRLRQHQRVTPLLAQLEELVAGLGAPATWATSLAWLRLELALAAERHADVAAVAAELAAAAPTDPRHAALAQAAAAWAEVGAGRVEPDAVLAAAAALADTALPWEGSRLAGQAAIRTPDPATARRLLERARDLAGGDAGDDTGEADGSGLTERELEVARYVADGLTHKEIGAQLYISPKTVEHHVARIRTKLGVTTRAEMLAAFRALLDADDR